MKTIYFVRHGESEANAEGVAAGGGLDVDLTEDGRHQAKKVGEDLRDKKIELIVSSPMKRAKNTAKIIADVIGYDASKIVINESFTERHLGDMTGAKKELIKTYYDANILPPGGETTESMHRRIIEGLEWLKAQPADRIALVSHGGPGRMLRTIYMQERHDQINTLDRIGNAEILELNL